MNGTANVKAGQAASQVIAAMPIEIFLVFSALVFALGLGTGYIGHGFSHDHRTALAAQEAYLAERDYYNKQTEAIIADGRQTSKERPYGNTRRN